MTKTNHTAASRHCEQSEAIQRKKPLAWIASFLAMTSCLLFTSCEKEIEFNGEQTDPKLVVNSLVEPGRRVEASMSKSCFFLQSPPDMQAPADLQALLYVNGALVGGMTPFADTVWELYGDDDDYTVRSGFYNDYCAQVGDIIKIMASASGYDDVEGTTSPLPTPVEVEAEYEVTEWHSEYFHQFDYETFEYEEDSMLFVSGTLNMTVTLNDPNPGVADCFRLSTGLNKKFFGYPCYLNCDYSDPVFGGSFTNDEFLISDIASQPEGVFTDLLFDGSSYQIKMEVYFNCQLALDDTTESYRVPFLMEHLTKEYLNYLSTCDQGDMSMQIWAEPIQTYTNVTNGFGIVAGRTVDTLWIELPLVEP
ncbi:MAG: DUF4249 domain-containing protein [Bacteroidales bacterium]|nr:DUF4249 domain-containing protein [Bacteroidales bacterium]